MLSYWQVDRTTRDVLEKCALSVDGAPDRGLVRFATEQVQSRIGQAIDIAVNFPTAILTLIAYLTLPALKSTSTWFVVLLTVGTGGVLILAGSPSRVGWYNALSIRGSISGLSLVLLVANIVGLVLAW